MRGRRRRIVGPLIWLVRSVEESGVVYISFCWTKVENAVYLLLLLPLALAPLALAPARSLAVVVAAGLGLLFEFRIFRG